MATVEFIGKEKEEDKNKIAVGSWWRSSLDSDVYGLSTVAVRCVVLICLEDNNNRYARMVEVGDIKKITLSEWKQITGGDPSYFTRIDKPLIKVIEGAGE